MICCSNFHEFVSLQNLLELLPSQGSIVLCVTGANENLQDAFGFSCGREWEMVWSVFMVTEIVR